MIAARRKELGLTYAQMGAKATAAGYPISRAMLHHWTTHELENIPPTESLLAIAAAIDCDPDEVLAAAAYSVGITPRDVQVDRSTRAVLALLSDRTPEQIAALESVLKSASMAMDIAAGRQSGDTEAAPPNGG